MVSSNLKNIIVRYRQIGSFAQGSGSKAQSKKYSKAPPSHQHSSFSNSTGVFNHSFQLTKHPLKQNLGLAYLRFQQSFAFFSHDVLLEAFPNNSVTKGVDLRSPSCILQNVFTSWADRTSSSIELEAKSR